MPEPHGQSVTQLKAQLLLGTPLIEVLALMVPPPLPTGFSVSFIGA